MPEARGDSIPLMREITEKLGTQDSQLPEKLQMGLPIVGVADESPFFSQYVAPADGTIARSES